MTDPDDDPRPVFEYSVRDRRHWRRLAELFERDGLGPREILTQFPAYVRRRDLARFLAHAEIFRQVIDVPGSIVEIGVFRGASLMTWCKLLETFCPADRTRKVYGFDHFRGLVDQGAGDPGAPAKVADADQARWRGTAEHARTLVELANDDSLIAGVERVRLVEGDVVETLPPFLKRNPGLRLSLLHLDADLYAPSQAALEVLWDRLVPGGIVIADQYGLVPWEGESRAVDELLAGLPVRPRLRSLPYAAQPGAYFVKE